MFIDNRLNKILQMPKNYGMLQQAAGDIMNETKYTYITSDNKL